MKNDNEKITLYSRRLGRDFSAQRNFGLEKATGDWILFVDADEAVPPELKKEIQDLTQNSAIAQHCEGYSLKRRDYFFGRWLRYGETASVRLVRLAKKDTGRWEGRVHEVWKIDGSVGELQHALEHYPHPTISEFLESINIYTSYLTPTLSFQESGTFRLITYPIGKFLQNYILRRGFLDGIPGLIMAVMMSLHSFLVRAKGWQIKQSMLHNVCMF